jgi:hypothetical protein
MCFLQGQVDHVSVTYPAFGDNMVGKVLHIRAKSLEHSNFHAAILIEMHMKRRLCEVEVFVEIACEALWQFPRAMIVNIDESCHARIGATDLHDCLLEAGAGEIADCL